MSLVARISLVNQNQLIHMSSHMCFRQEHNYDSSWGRLRKFYFFCGIKFILIIVEIHASIFQQNNPILKSLTARKKPAHCLE